MQSRGDHLAVGQIGQRVMQPQVMRALLGLVQARQIGADADIVGDAPDLVAQHGDRLQQRIQPAITRPVPELPLEAVMHRQLAPHPGREGRPLPAGAQQARVAADHLLGRVAGNPAEGGIDRDDVARRIGHQDGLAGRLEDARGQPQRLVLVMLAGDVARHAQHADQHLALAAQRRLQHLVAAPLAGVAEGQPFLVDMQPVALERTAVVAAEEGGLLGGEDIHVGAAAQLGLGAADDALEGGVAAEIAPLRILQPGQIRQAPEENAREIGTGRPEAAPVLRRGARTQATSLRP